MAVPGVNQVSEADRTAAIKSFEALGICSQLAEAAVALGWKTPSSIQEQAIPHVLAGASHPTNKFI
jgi:superfamily II DNA/RNA helicase